MSSYETQEIRKNDEIILQVMEKSERKIAKAFGKIFPLP